MRIHYFRYLLLFALALYAEHASAFIGPPYVTPAHPMAGDTISVNVYRGECDVLSIGIVPPAVEEHDGHITALFTGIHEDDPEWCIYSTGTETVAIGSFPLGSYTLDVERRYMTVFGTWHQETLGIIPFVVSGDPARQPVEALTLNVAGLAGLLLTLIAVAHFALRRNI
jgi:hypothetical protein